MKGALLCFAIIACSHPVFSQIHLSGHVLDSVDQSTLAYVNIGIKAKNIGTVSNKEGFFTIDFPEKFVSDSLVFSLVGYHEVSIPIRKLRSQQDIKIRLTEEVTILREVTIKGEKLVERKYGIKKRGVVHFTDGIFKKDDSFEIGQVLNLGAYPVQLTSLNLHLNSSRSDSANFRINFYRYDDQDNLPKERIIQKSILQRHPIREGWLKFDLSEHNILLKGKVLASIEFIPERAMDVKQIFYEVKIGGSSKSFFRRSSLGQWIRPPHHYCLYATALANKGSPEEIEDIETAATVSIQSDFSKEPFSLFVRLPEGYDRDSLRTYPVIYLLDGNAFFDPIADFADRIGQKQNQKSIVVGIGYENAYVMDSLRDRDYTFPPAIPQDSFSVSGQADKFYRFIKTRIVPRVDSVYRTDKTNRTIMGHSLGGYFVLYALTCHLSEQPLFNNYVAASPSISYHNGYLLEKFEGLKQKATVAHGRLYLTIGELEIAEDNDHIFDKFSRLLQPIAPIEVRTRIYKKMEHMGTAIPSFEDGLRFVFVK